MVFLVDELLLLLLLLVLFLGAFGLVFLVDELLLLVFFLGAFGLGDLTFLVDELLLVFFLGALGFEADDLSDFDLRLAKRDVARHTRTVRLTLVDRPDRSAPLRSSLLVRSEQQRLRVEGMTRE